MVKATVKATVSAAAARRRQWAKLALIALWLPLTFGARVLETPQQGDSPLLDDGWKIGLAQRWQQGEIAGRDFSYTYGPAAQGLAGLGASWQRADSDSSSAACDRYW
jgi:hypothetical protein